MPDTPMPSGPIVVHRGYHTTLRSEQEGEGAPGGGGNRLIQLLAPKPRPGMSAKEQERKGEGVQGMKVIENRAERKQETKEVEPRRRKMGV